MSHPADYPDFNPATVVSRPIPVKFRVLSDRRRKVSTIIIICPVNRLEDVPKQLSLNVQGDFTMEDKLDVGAPCLWTSGVMSGQITTVTPDIHKVFTACSQPQPPDPVDHVGSNYPV